MMDFADLDRLKAEWDALQPLAEDYARRLWKKLRLEWNYHSNHIEGNTLTYGETELLLLHDRAVGDHALREFEEMKAHDVGIGHVRLLAADPGRPLTEGDVRDLNRIILKEPYWKPAETPDGQPTRKQIIPGEYKTTPNSVRTATGDIFEYASPQETPIRMAALVQWLRNILARGSVHPIAAAARLHHEFVLIHPFDAGNGRVARLLVNYLLLRCGYPPTIVRSEDKAHYLTALRKADAGELDGLTEYLASLLDWSLKLGIRAAKGESIEELSDTEKEVALFVRGQQARRSQEAGPTNEMIAELFNVSLFPFLEGVEAKLMSLASLFRGFEITVAHGVETYRSIKSIPVEAFENLRVGQSLSVDFFFRSYRGDASTPFNLLVELGFHFPPARYSITHAFETASYPYSKPLLGGEAEELAVNILAKSFSRIKALAGEKD